MKSPLFLCIAALLVTSEGRICSSQITQGPYVLKRPNSTHSLPSKHGASFQITTIEEDARLMIAYRGYWRSYCYNGGSLDPNTGCHDEYKDFLPDEKEMQVWNLTGKCKVQDDCVNCWGSDSDQCTGDWLARRSWHFVDHKELTRASANNRFAHHVCNLQWRCGFHKSGWKTFLRISRGVPEAYFLNKDGVPFYLEEGKYQAFGDFALMNVRRHSSKTEFRTLECHGHDRYICYDQKLGNLIDLSQGYAQCFQSTCYITEPKLIQNNTKPRNVELQRASLEDLKMLHMESMILSEQIKYDFLLTKKAFDEVHDTLISVIESIAKIDDRLIGEILKRPARTRFLSKNTFLVSPCSEDPRTQSNCVNNSIYQDGRWLPNLDPQACVNFNASTPLGIWDEESYWLPDLVAKTFLGVIGDQEGWSFYAQEKNRLKDSMTVTANLGEGTSIGDAFKMPAGQLSSVVNAVFYGKIILFSTICVMSLLLLRIMVRLFR